MNWYRATFVINGKKSSVEVEAHSAGDAGMCALYKSGVALMDDDDGDARLVDLECIEPPEHARLKRRAAQVGQRGFAKLMELTEAAQRLEERKP